MSDYYDDEYANDYNDADIEINYGYDDHVDQDQGINFEDMIIEAKSENQPSKFREIIELEKDNATTCHFSFQAYQYLALIYIKEKNMNEFQNAFVEIAKLYAKVDYTYKIDTMRDIIYALSYCNDNEFSSSICRIIIDALFDRIGEDKSIDRELLNTGVLFSKNLLLMGKYDQLGELLEEMFDIMDRMNMTDDESLNNSKLELIVLKIQYCNIKKLSKEAKQLYYEAYDLNKNKVIMDNTISSIINEQGGKLYMSQRNYEKALELFKQAFYNFQSAGNINKAKEMIKYSVLNSIIVRNSMSFVSNEEVMHFKDDKQLEAMLNLRKAYESADIIEINKVWNEQVLKIENDEFILNQLNEILHSIRFNYIRMKLSAYNICKFSTLTKELGVDQDYLINILLELISSDQNVNFKINFIDQSVVVKERNMENEIYYSNITKWINSFASLNSY